MEPVKWNSSTWVCLSAWSQVDIPHVSTTYHAPAGHWGQAKGGRKDSRTYRLKFGIYIPKNIKTCSAWQRSAKKHRFLYKKKTPILMVKILDFNCVRNFWQKGTVYTFSLIYICLDFHQKQVFCKPLCSSSTIFLPMHGYATTTSEK